MILWQDKVSSIPRISQSSAWCFGLTFSRTILVRGLFTQQHALVAMSSWYINQHRSRPVRTMEPFLNRVYEILFLVNASAKRQTPEDAEPKTQENTPAIPPLLESDRSIFPWEQLPWELREMILGYTKVANGLEDDEEAHRLFVESNFEIPWEKYRSSRERSSGRAHYVRILENHIPDQTVNFLMRGHLIQSIFFALLFKNIHEGQISNIEFTPCESQTGQRISFSKIENEIRVLVPNALTKTSFGRSVLRSFEAYVEVTEKGKEIHTSMITFFYQFVRDLAPFMWLADQIDVTIVPEAFPRTHYTALFFMALPQERLLRTTPVRFMRGLSRNTVILKTQNLYGMLEKSRKKTLYLRAQLREELLGYTYHGNAIL